MALAGVAAGWFMWLRPTTLGGRESYVVVHGSSMKPTYDDGDLVIVREEGDYDEGEVIAFRVGGQFHDRTLVIHRIVGRAEDGAFTTRGDNRDRIDPWQPGPEDILGRAIIHVPVAGDLVTAASRPEVLAAIGGTAVVVGGRKRRRRRVNRPHDGAPFSQPVAPSRQPGGATPPRWARHTHPRWAFYGLVVSACLAGPMLVLAWSAIRASDTTVRVEHIGEVGYGVGLDYRFTGDTSAVYPSGVVVTRRNAAGALVPTDPLYSKLLHRLELTLAFRAANDGGDRLESSYQVDVAVTMAEGWSSILASIEPTRFDGSAEESIAIDLDYVAARVAEVAALTGVGGNEYKLVVSPRVEVDASAAGEDVSGAISPPVTFDVKAGVITVQAIEDASDTKELAREVNQRADYDMGPVSLGTQAARGVLGGLVLVLLTGVIWFASVLFGGLGLRESDRIAARYRSQMVDVAAATAPAGPVVMVTAIDELARLARVEQSVILHEDLGDGGHRYRVFIGAVTYEYETAPEHAGRATQAEAGSAADQTGS